MTRRVNLFVRDKVRWQIMSSLTPGSGSFQNIAGRFSLYHIRAECPTVPAFWIPVSLSSSLLA
jgi:hypothetical protein